MSGEHGDGRARGELLPVHVLTRRHRDIRRGEAHLRPGRPAQPGRDRRARRPSTLTCACRPRRPLRNGLGFAYPHDGGDLATAVHRCVGVGKCRADTTATGGVMCPSFLATRDEKDSTRGRARVLQELANGSLVKGFGSDELAESLDLCLSCKGCSSDCPAGVDMATYKAEALYQRYRRRLRPMSHYALGWLPRWARARRARAATDECAARPSSRRRAEQAARRNRRAPAAAQLRDRDVPGLVRRPAGTVRRGPPGAPVRRHVHRALQPRGRTVGGDRTRGGRLPGDDPRPSGLLRADVDLDRPTRRGPQAAAQESRCARSRAAARDCDRRARTVVHRGVPVGRHRAAARRPSGRPGQSDREDARGTVGGDARLDGARSRPESPRSPSRIAIITR